MYLSIGSNTTVAMEKVVGIFNLEGMAKGSFLGKEFTPGRDASCVLTDDGARFSGLSSLTLKKRAQESFLCD
jgi:hypothetical protein